MNSGYASKLAKSVNHVRYLYTYIMIIDYRYKDRF